MKKIRIGIIAPSSQIPRVEFQLGIERIKKAGFEVISHPQCMKRHMFFAGKDLERAKAFFDFALRSDLSMIWCARGGYGATRLLPLLDEFTKKQGIPPKKLLMGYSDITALMEYTRKNWGWSTLHAPMPSLRKFSILPQADWNAMTEWIQQRSTESPWAGIKLKYWTKAPEKAIRAPLVGGNLTVWNCLLGTPYEATARGSLLFLEDVDESLYRIDRMLCQLSMSQSLMGVKGIILGNFMNCKDYSPQVLKEYSQKKGSRILLSPRPDELKPLRKTFNPDQALKAIFKEWGEKLRIPVAHGLPVGHGPEVSPLPLGAQYELSPDGKLKLLKWDWLDSA